jgi:2-methylaconitate cis-trans-isomerase PrpF
LRSLLFPRAGRAVVTGAVAVLAALAMAAPSGAATMVESTGATSLNFSHPAGATSLNFAQPGESTALNFTRIG